MSEEYGNDFIVLTDEDGEEHELEHLDTLEHQGQVYLAFIPAGADEGDEPVELIILKSVVDEESGEELLSTLDSDEEAEMVYDLFMEKLNEEEEDS